MPSWGAQSSLKDEKYSTPPSALSPSMSASRPGCIESRKTGSGQGLLYLLHHTTVHLINKKLTNLKKIVIVNVLIITTTTTTTTTIIITMAIIIIIIITTAELDKVLEILFITSSIQVLF